MVKYRQYVFILFAFLISVILLETRAFGLSAGFTTEELPTTEKSQFINSVNICLLKEEPEKKSIECFDVNAAGDVAVGFSHYDTLLYC